MIIFILTAIISISPLNQCKLSTFIKGSIALNTARELCLHFEYYWFLNKEKHCKNYALFLKC
jgi:hypothetical protein